MLAMAKIVQINLHHCKAASAALVLRLAEKGEDIALIQEPWTNNGKILGLSASGYRLLYATQSGNNGKSIRSCILAKANLNIFILSNYSDEDTVTAAWETGGSTIWILSCYMAHDHVDPPPQNLVHRMVTDADTRGIPIIMGADANAHHHIWGSSDTNTRGECIFDFILDNNLVVLNQGSEPTFAISNRQEVLDITLASESLAHKMQGWRVSTECSFSDHRYLEFSVNIDYSNKRPFLNRRKTNWEEQKYILTSMIA